VESGQGILPHCTCEVSEQKLLSFNAAVAELLWPVIKFYVVEHNSADAADP